MKIIVIFSCSGMFRNVPACSGLFRVPGFIDGHFDTEMSNKCLVLIISVAFVGVTVHSPYSFTQI